MKEFYENLIQRRIEFEDATITEYKKINSLAKTLSDLRDQE